MKAEIFAITTGLLLGAASIGLKMFLNGGGLLTLLPVAILGLLGVVAFQFALKHGKSYLVSAIVAGVSAAAAALGGAFLLGEQLAQLEMIGIIIILAGVALATRF